MAERKSTTRAVNKTPEEVTAVETEVKEPAKRATRKTSTKKETEGKKTPAKKEATAKDTPVTVSEKPVKKTAAKKATVSTTVNFELNGNSYTPEKLLDICKDVWQYDLNGKEEDLESIELYVKPEENTTYYVINGEIKGGFHI